MVAPVAVAVALTRRRGLAAWENYCGGLVAVAPATATATAPAAAATATAVDDHENNHHDSDCNKSCDHPSLG